MQGNATEAAPVVGVEIDCTVLAGRDLVAKDHSLFGKKSSDPYVVISCGRRMLGTTKVVKKNLSPVWDQHFKCAPPSACTLSPNMLSTKRLACGQAKPQRQGGCAARVY